jgi:hypothetical protein
MDMREVRVVLRFAASWRARSKNRNDTLVDKRSQIRVLAAGWTHEGGAHGMTRKSWRLHQHKRSYSLKAAESANVSRSG